MSLINIKNFVEPIIDKRNLVTIILIAGLFGMIRLSGGTAGTVDRTREAPRTTQPRSVERVPVAETSRGDFARTRSEVGRTVMDELRENDPLGNQGSSARRPSDTRTRDPFIDSARRAPAPQKKEVKKPTRGSEGLDDIEKQLGLR